MHIEAISLMQTKTIQSSHMTVFTNCRFQTCFLVVVQNNSLGCARKDVHSPFPLSLRLSFSPISSFSQLLHFARKAEAALNRNVFCCCFYHYSLL